MHDFFRRTPIGRFLLLAMIVALPLSGFGCKGASKETIERSKPITLKYWRVFDDEDAFAAIIADYRKIHPNITIEYRKFRLEEYEKALLNGLAEDQGPDIFSIHHTWMYAWQPRLLPVPAVLTVPFQEITGGLKKEVITTLRQVPGITLKQLASDYVDAVANDVVIPTEQADPRAPLVPRIYGLPLSVDTLAMYYNRDMLNNAGIAEPATDWRTFQDQVKRITKLDEVGTIVKSGAALGSADNVERSQDILALLMMQNGAKMTAGDSDMATFDKYPPELAGRPLPPGAEALVFYTDFSNPEKEVYTWNDKMPSSFDAFARGQTAFFFGYSYHLPAIRAANPKLNFGIAPFPQIEGNKPVNYANYWVEVVSKKTTHPDETWDFLQFVAKEESAKKHLAVTRRPTALRALVNSQLSDLDLSVFAAQVPDAKSWYHGTNASAAEEAFAEMIRQMHSGDFDPKKIVELAATKVNQTVR